MVDTDSTLLRQARPSARPLAELLRLSVPTIVQMVSYTLMQFIDTWMLSRIGDDVAAAAGMSGMLAFSALSLGIGALWLVNTLASQSYGRGDYGQCGRYMWQGAWFTLAYSAVLAPLVPVLCMAFEWFGHSPRMARMESTYLLIALLATPIKLAGAGLGQFTLAINRPMSVLMSAVAGVVANVAAAWVLIFGALGAPRLELAGAAWAQNIGVTVETLVLIVLAARPHIRRTYGLGDMRFRRGPFVTLLRLGLPAGAQFVSDVLAWTLFSTVAIGVFAEAGMAANMYTFRYMSVSFMPAIGIGTAVTALVGRYIGAGRPDVAEQRAHLGFSLAAGYMLACGLVFFLARHALMRLFTDDPQVLRLGAMLLVFAAVYQVFDAMYVIYSGALRGAGDTFVPAVATASLNWTLTVGVGYALARLVPSLGVAGPWSAATFYGVSLGLFLLLRFRRGRWKAIRLEEGRGDRLQPAGREG